MKMNNINEALLNRAGAKVFEQRLRETLAQTEELGIITRELSSEITIPVATWLEIGGSDSDTRFEVHQMIMKAIALGFAAHIERHIKPEGREEICEIFSRWFINGLQQALQLVVQERFKEDLKALGIDIQVFERKGKKS